MKSSEPEQPLSAIEDLDAASDITAFLRKGVPEGLRKAALRRVWSLDPAIRDFVSPAEYAWDFNDPGSIPGFSSSVGTMDLTGFFSGERAAEHAVVGGAEAEKAAVPQPSEVPLLMQASAAERSQPFPSSSLSNSGMPELGSKAPESGPSHVGPGEQSSLPVETQSDELSDTSPRRHGGALPR